MSTSINVERNDIAKYPYIFRINGRTFYLQQSSGGVSSWWHLVEYDQARTYPQLGRWSYKKNHKKMVGEALALILEEVDK